MNKWMWAALGGLALMYLWQRSKVETSAGDNIPGVPRTPVKPSVPRITMTSFLLRRGAAAPKEDVTGLQKALVYLGHLVIGEEEYGTFGAKTDRAVRDYQKKKNLAIDGVVGEKTAAKLNEDLQRDGGYFYYRPVVIRNTIPAFGPNKDDTQL
jgi:hypothetical protein